MIKKNNHLDYLELNDFSLKVQNMCSPSPTLNKEWAKVDIKRAQRLWISVELVTVANE